MDAEIAEELNGEGFPTARGRRFSGNLVWLLRHQWQIPNIKENGNKDNPLRWADGTYSIQGVAGLIGVTVGTVHKWIRAGRLTCRQRSKGMLWKIALSDDDIVALREYVGRVRRIRHSKMEVA